MTQRHRGVCPVCGTHHPFAALFCSPACRRADLSRRKQLDWMAELARRDAQCVWLTKRGGHRCRKPALKGDTPYCWLHDRISRGEA